MLRYTGLQVDDVSKAAGVVADMRKVFRQDTRVIQKLHRRVFLDKITKEQVCFLDTHQLCVHCCSVRHTHYGACLTCIDLQCLVDAHSYDHLTTPVVPCR